MNSMEGFILKYCNLKCSKAVPEFRNLVISLNAALKGLNLENTLQEKFSIVQQHHLIKIGISGCPNGCSQPQIKDIGVIGYLTPQVTLKDCTECNICTDACTEQAICFSDTIFIDKNSCLSCGDCFRACPTGSIQLKETGWNLYLGGRLGRHPRLGHLSSNTSENDKIVQWIIELLKDYTVNAPVNVRFSNYLEKRIL